MLSVGSLFAGIGGIELGLERTGGFKTVWQVELDDYARRVLAKHWPDVIRWDDVRTFPPEGDWSCDLICGGFPCKEVSVANQYEHAAQGVEGPNSGLWSEYRRVVSVLRPRFVLVENSPAITSRGLGRVLGDLAGLRYDAEWARIPAGLFGSAHRRDRLFVLAWQAGGGLRGESADGSGSVHRGSGLPQRGLGGRCDAGRIHGLLSSGVADLVADANIQRREGNLGGVLAGGEPDTGYLTRLYGDDRQNPFIGLRCGPADVCRKRDGTANWLDRIRCLGNAVVPQVAKFIGERILEAEEDRP